MIEIKQNQNGYITYGQMNLINDFRAHWTELGIWARSYMVSTITGFSNLAAISNRLYRIPKELGEMFEPYFGMEISEQFQQLLLLYVVHVQTLISAINSRDQQAADAAAVMLYNSSDDIADFLARVNPYWNKSQWQSFFNRLNEMIILEMIAILSGEYEKELDIRDRIFRHSLIMGDYMASGVIKYLVPDQAPAE